MTKEEILSIIEKGEVNIAELNKNSSYIISIEFGMAPKEQVEQIARFLANSLKRVQIKHFIIVPTVNGLPSLKFYEFKDNQVNEVVS